MLLECAGCKAMNRVPAQYLARNGKCGGCKTRLPALAHPIDVGPEEFADIQRHARVPILVDFWAPWCGPCKTAAPEVAKVAAEMAGKAVVLKVNTDAHPSLASSFGVSGIPNFIVIKDGHVVRQQAGVMRHTQLQQWLVDVA